MVAGNNYAVLHSKVVSRPGAKDRIAELREATLEELRLYELRLALGRSQTDLAEEIGVSQSAVSQVESGTDIKLSTLRNYVEGLGGRLEVVAIFDDVDEEHVVQVQIGETGPRDART
jgi:predicted transcriptional regulator